MFRFFTSNNAAQKISQIKHFINQLQLRSALYELESLLVQTASLDTSVANEIVPLIFQLITHAQFPTLKLLNEENGITPITEAEKLYSLLINKIPANAYSTIAMGIVKGHLQLGKIDQIHHFFARKILDESKLSPEDHRYVFIELAKNGLKHQREEMALWCVTKLFQRKQLIDANAKLNQEIETLFTNILNTLLYKQLTDFLETKNHDDGALFKHRMTLLNFILSLSTQDNDAETMLLKKYYQTYYKPLLNAHQESWKNLNRNSKTESEMTNRDTANWKHFIESLLIELDFSIKLERCLIQNKFIADYEMVWVVQKMLEHHFAQISDDVAVQLVPCYDEFLQLANSLHLPHANHSKPTWLQICLSHNETLASYRHKFFSQANTDLTAAMQDYQSDVLGLLHNALKAIEELLGPPPCPWSLGVMGSFARGDMSLLSDLDMFVLIKEQNKRAHPYFKTAMQLFRLYLISLADPWKFNNAPLSSGLFIDDGDWILMFLEQEASDVDQRIRLINTPGNLANQVIHHLTNSNTSIYDHKNYSEWLLAYSLLTIKPVYSSAGGAALIEEYGKFLQNAQGLDLIKIGEASLSALEHQVPILSRLTNRKNDAESFFNEKDSLKDVYRIFTLTGLSTCFFSVSISRLQTLQHESVQNILQVHFSKGFGNSWREAWKKLQLSRIKYQNQFKQCNFKLVELEATDQADINNIIQTLLAPFYQYWQRADITKFYSPWKRLIDNHINEANYQKLLDWCLHAKQQGDDVTIPGSLHTQLWEYITEIIPTQLPSHSRYYEYETWLTQNFPGQKYSISEIMSFIKYQGINIDIILSKQKKTAFIEALTNNHLAWAIALISHGASSAIYEIDVLMKLLSPFYENRSHHNQLRKMIKILGNNNITLVKLLNDKLSLKSLTNRAFKLLQAKTSSNNKQILELETQEILLQQSIAKINNTYQQSTDNDCKLACAKILASIESNFSDAFLRSLAILVAQTNIDKIHHATNTSIVKKLLGQPVFRRALETNIYKILSDETAETDSRLAMIDLSLKMGYSADDICNLLVAQLFTKNRVVGQKIITTIATPLLKEPHKEKITKLFDYLLDEDNSLATFQSIVNATIKIGLENHIITRIFNQTIEKLPDTQTIHFINWSLTAFNPPLGLRFETNILEAVFEHLPSKPTKEALQLIELIENIVGHLQTTAPEKCLQVEESLQDTLNYGKHATEVVASIYGLSRLKSLSKNVQETLEQTVNNRDLSSQTLPILKKLAACYALKKNEYQLYTPIAFLIFDSHQMRENAIFVLNHLLPRINNGNNLYKLFETIITNIKAKITTENAQAIMHFFTEKIHWERLIETEKKKFLEYLLDNFDDPNEPFADFAYSMAKRLGLGREIFITTNKNNNRNIVSTLLDSFFETVNSQSFLTAQENLLTLLKSEQQELTMKIIILITKKSEKRQIMLDFLLLSYQQKKLPRKVFFEILFNLDFEAKHSLQRLKAAPIVKELLVTYIDKNFMFAIKLLVELQWTSHAPNLTTDLINLLNNQAYQSVHIDIIKGLGQLGADTHIRIEILQQINIAFENNQLSDYQYAMVLMQLIDHCDTLFENCSKNTRRNSNSSDFFPGAPPPATINLVTTSSLTPDY